MKENAIKALQFISRYDAGRSEWDIEKFDTEEEFAGYFATPGITPVLFYFNTEHPKRDTIEFPATLLMVSIEREDLNEYLPCNPDGHLMVDDSDILIWEL